MSNRWKVKLVALSEIELLKKNAHFMNKAEFDQLTQNIAKHKELTSVPTCVKQKNGKYLVISGNHRVKAARAAGLNQIHILYCHENEISNDEQLAIQLSHNSIKGSDDLIILKELVESINSMEYKEFAFINEEDFEELDRIRYEMLNPMNATVMYTFAFFESSAEAFESLKREINLLPSSAQPNVELAPRWILKDFNEIVSKIQQEFGLKSTGLAIVKMVELASRQLFEEEE